MGVFLYRYECDVSSLYFWNILTSSPVLEPFSSSAQTYTLKSEIVYPQINLDGRTGNLCEWSQRSAKTVMKVGDGFVKKLRI